MSEFSESFHLKGCLQEDVVNLLKQASLKGYVMPPADNWVSFVLEEYQYEQLNEDLIRLNKGQLVHYTFSEDSDWTISVYKDSKRKRVMHYNCNWEEGEIVINDEELDLEIIKDLAASPVSDEELNSIFYPEDEDALFDEIPLAYRIAAVLGLKRYDWFSYNYIEGLIETGDTDAEPELDSIIAVG